MIKLNIVETIDPSEFNAPIFAHSRVGKNVDPKSKIDAFIGYMTQGIGDRADIAFFKLCYVDIEKGTDVAGLFKYYKEKIKYLHTLIIQSMLYLFDVP